MRKLLTNLGIATLGIAMLMALASTASAQQDYSDVTTVSTSTTAFAGGQATVTFSGDPGFAPGSQVTITTPSGGTFVVTVGANGVVTAQLPGSVLGETVTVAGVDAGGNSISGTTTVGAAVLPTTVAQTTTPVVPVVPVVVPVVPVVVTAQDAGFTNGIPTQPGKASPIAVTGGNTRIPVLLGVTLLGAGGLALFSARRRQLTA